MSLSSFSNTPPSEMLSSPSKRLVRSKSGLKILSQHERGVPPWNLEEPHWIKDQEAASCMNCQAKFDFLKRRHHCRRCGKIFCGKCCSAKVQFHRMGFVDPVRVCSACEPTTKRERDFFETRLKTLFGGAPFHVRLESSIDKTAALYTARLTSDERMLVFENHKEDEGEQLGPVDLCRINTFECTNEDGDDNAGLCLTFREPGCSDQTLHFRSPPEPSRKPSVAWLQVFSEGMKMVFHSRSMVREDNSPEELLDNTPEPSNDGSNGSAE